MFGISLKCAPIKRELSVIYSFVSHQKEATKRICRLPKELVKINEAIFSKDRPKSDFK